MENEWKNVRRAETANRKLLQMSAAFLYMRVYRQPYLLVGQKSVGGKKNANCTQNRVRQTDSCTKFG